MDEAELDAIRRLEEELLLPEVRSDASRLDEILHADFVEFGSSGTTWTREEILARLPTEDDFSASISDFEVQRVAPDVALATFKARVSNERARNVVSLRSSVWILDAGAWKVRFHQGSPVSPHAA